MLDKGADPNSPDYDGCTPLHIACGTGGNNCIDLLIQYGAKIN